MVASMCLLDSSPVYLERYPHYFSHAITPEEEEIDTEKETLTTKEFVSFLKNYMVSKLHV